MSNISAAIANDYNKYKVGGGRAGIYNPQVLTGKQSVDQFDLAPQRLLEIQQRKDQERALKRQLREAEGGRGGGFNDRQIVERKSADDEDEGEYDDFGRRRKTATVGDWRAKLKQKKEGGQSSGSKAAAARGDDDGGSSAAAASARGSKAADRGGADGGSAAGAASGSARGATGSATSAGAATAAPLASQLRPPLAPLVVTAAPLAATAAPLAPAARSRSPLRVNVVGVVVPGHVPRVVPPRARGPPQPFDFAPPPFGFAPPGA